MDFEIEQTQLLAALAMATNVAERRGTMPVLSNVLIRADPDSGVTFSTTDMMVSLVDTIECPVTAAGSITIGVKHLHNVVRVLPVGPVRFTALDNSWVKITARRSEFKIMGLPGRDFPELPDPDGLTWRSVPARILAALIEKTIGSVSADEARVNLNGGLFECDGAQATMVSTDGHRLTKYTLPLEGPELAKGIIVPRKGMDEIRKVLARVDGECKIGVSDQHLFVQADALTLSVKLNRVTFPPWQQVVPAKYDRRVGVDREALIAALRQAEVIAPEKTATVRVSLRRGMIELHADNPELGAITLDLPVDFTGTDMDAGFNANYLLESLACIDTDQIHLDFGDALDPVVVRPSVSAGEAPDFLAVVMPMRI